MKLLVTGGCGFIGSNFILHRLKVYPDEVIINIDKLTYSGNLENLRGVEKNPNYIFIKSDIGDMGVIDKLLDQVDAVVNFAAETHVDRSIEGPKEFLDTNIFGTYNLLMACRKHNKRFHQVSTDEVFGQLGENDEKFSENHPYHPRSPYAATKASADHLSMSFYHTYGLPVTISYGSNNYGPYQYPEKVIPLFVTNLLEGKKVPLYGKGSNIRDWLFVEDHVKGIEAILEKGKIGEVYCLGGDNEISNLDLTNIILEKMGRDDDMIEYVADRLGHDFRYALDCSKADKDLGWKPKMLFEEGIALTIQWYIENQEWWKKIKYKK